MEGNGLACVPRSPAALLGVVEGLRVETNTKYMAGDEKTWCNLFVHDVTMAMDCPIPFILANAQYDWLSGEEGASAGWTSATLDEAQWHAELGAPAVVVWKNPSKGHGHIAVVVPAPPERENHVYIAQAGKENFSCRPIERGFGLSLHPSAFCHP